jgi:uncharacterized protein YndB with AHSA1/START domain
MAQTTQAKTLRLERTFDASPEELWSSWTDPKRFARWFNPAPGHDIVVHEWDPRPGGKARFDMPQPDGNPNTQEGVFHTLTPYSLLEQGAPDKSFLIAVHFEPAGARTRMRVEVTGVPPEWHAMAAKGWKAGFTKLDAQLDQLHADRAILLSRVVQASPQRVWEALTDPAQLAQWWGPNGFRTTTESIEVRPGGLWKSTMHGPDGRDYPNWARYVEVVPPERLTYDHGGGKPGETRADFHMRITLEDLGGRTKVTFRHLFARKEDRDYVVREYGALEGGKQTLAHLAEHVAPTPPQGKAQVAVPPGTREIRVVRVFDAPRAKVWRALTEPELLARWWGRGNKLVVERFEARPGGHWRFVEHSEGGPQGFEGRFADLQPPERLVMTFEWDGMPGHVALQDMSLEELPDGRTKLVATSLFMTQEDRDGMVASGMEGGMNESYAALDKVLAGL